MDDASQKSKPSWDGQTKVVGWQPRPVSLIVTICLFVAWGTSRLVQAEAKDGECVGSSVLFSFGALKSSTVKIMAVGCFEDPRCLFCKNYCLPSLLLFRRRDGFAISFMV
jgi:hypothetical protein